MFSLIATIVIGLVVGLLARLIMPGKDTLGIFMTILLGIAGSFIAKYAGQFLGIYNSGQTAGFIASIIGAVALLAIYRLLKSKS